MRRYLVLLLCFACTVAQAATSLRVGSKVLTLGDSATRVQQLMGEPTTRAFTFQQVNGMPDNQLAPAEEWQYAQDGKTEIITLVGGRVVKFDTLYE
ncbi:DUF2845 domain-containing protein [Dyella mobilis]|uniref:DUF2845 domain-containing protein n=1 Tax=Dyella mobilis TaxID=1849582 RepID=A0ABS2KMA1_9GAMM|nr:DUF2845 domain-containing protein [Dyella mobilis]MBM7132272.1 DUF2845 domain-containing protein [Dyella mobilis]GLQ95743.1 hypothetical protein GCM10007863_01610 [Dyella mobilis]